MDTLEKKGPEFYEALGRTIQVLRTDQSLDRKALADRAGISYSYLAAIENGKKPPSSRVLFAIAGALGLHTHELLASVETRFQRHRQFPRAAARLPAPSRRQAWFHGSPPRAADEARAAVALYPEAASAATWPTGNVPYTPAGFLMEIDRLNPDLTDEDRDLVLGLARRLADREA